ncbi:MAG TPA: DNA methyltransferase, partial [Urbifossiella sp.]|nr:DNA methyltransferase [Urbifossiella sp.]
MSPRAISARRRRASLRRIDPPRLIHGDCLRELPRLPSNSVDTCVTDPPYELGFMGKSWDSSGIAFDPATWRAVSRVLRPGGFLLCFGGTRTFHRVACAIEDAGFELRDCMMWLYGSGFPKSLDVSKAIDKRGGDPLAWRAVSEAA